MTFHLETIILKLHKQSKQKKSLEELIKLQKEDLILGAGRFLSVTDPMQASRIFNNPYFTLHNEMLPLLRDKGFTQIGIPGTSTIENIQGWTGTGPMK